MELPRVTCEPGSKPNSLIYHVGDGFYYTYNGGNLTTIWFRCSVRSCSGTAILQMGAAFNHSQQHNHPPDPTRHTVQAVRRVIIDRAASVKYVSFAEIVQEERRRIQNREIRARLTYRRLRSAMQRSRSHAYPNIPATMWELTATLQNPQWEPLTKTLDDEDTIYFSSVNGEDGSHSIIFLSERCLELLRQAPIIFLDGTFKISPSVSGCYQVFTIVTVFSHTVIPLAWCLMDSKTEIAYTSVLLQIRARLLQWNFRIAVSDYEDAIINSVEAVFGVEVQGCLFHYVNSVSSWAETSLTAAVLVMFPQVHQVVRQACVLPLLPQYLLHRGFNAIWMGAVNMGPWVLNLVQPFLEYVRFDWLQHVNRGRTLSVCGSDHRTNNASESNNHRMHLRIRVNHPNVYHFMRNVNEFEDTTIDDVMSLELGFIPNRHRKSSSVCNDAVIQGLTAALLTNPNPTDQDILQFLNAAAFSVENVMNNALGLVPNEENELHEEVDVDDVLPINMD